MKNSVQEKPKKEDSQKKANVSDLSPRTFIGIGLIVFAVLLFFNNIGFKLIGLVFSNWPVLLIIAGAVMIVQQRKTPNQKIKILPYFLVAIGILFTLAKYGVFDFSIGSLIAPIILLAVGFHLLKPEHTKNCGNWFCGGKNKSNKDLEYVDDEINVLDGISESNKIDIFTILGGGDYETHAQALKKGSVITVLGGTELDLREADCEGSTIEIDVLAFMGGVEIKVPPHWLVTCKVMPLLGGISNKTNCLADKLGVAKKHLVVTGLAFMGGIDIRN